MASAFDGHRSDHMPDLLTHLPPFQPTVALIAGILILVTPRFLNIIVALYLILVGASGLGGIK
jgi:hypothetical protein